VLLNDLFRVRVLRNHASLHALLNTVDSFTLCSVLSYEKTEVMFLGDTKPTTETVITLANERHITVKKAIKILGFILHMIKFFGES